MIGQVMNYCNKYFVDSVESSSGFAVVSDGVTGTFSETYIAGQYVSIDGSFLNDGVYKIISVTSAKLTLDATLTPEDTEDSFYIFGLKVPKDFLTIVDEISTYDASSQKGIKSESQGNRSVTYGTSQSGGSSSWQSVFMSSLAPYRALVSDKRSYMATCPDWQNKSGCW